MRKTQINRFFMSSILEPNSETLTSLRHQKAKESLFLRITPFYQKGRRRRSIARGMSIDWGAMHRGPHSCFAFEFKRRVHWRKRSRETLASMPVPRYHIIVFFLSYEFLISSSPPLLLLFLPMNEHFSFPSVLRLLLLLLTFFRMLQEECLRAPC